MTGKDWRTAAPKWAVEAATAEMAAMKRRLALRWPDEARPEPVPFHWGEYDRLTGTPITGAYWYIGRYGRPFMVQIREAIDIDGRSVFGQKFRFNYGENWTDKVQRGSLYMTERDALLAALWAACDEAAETLESVWNRFTSDRGYL
jgi:hypothetical protein